MTRYFDEIDCIADSAIEYAVVQSLNVREEKCESRHSLTTYGVTRFGVPWIDVDLFLFQ